jgi:protein gp37
MAEGTLIEWARHPVTGKGATWNIVTGCQLVSPGCTNCYAMKLAGSRLKNHVSRKGLTVDSKAGPVWNGKIRFNAEWLLQPFGWKKPHGIFVCAHGDLFADGVTDDMLDQIFAVMALNPQHIFYVLTKRPDRMLQYMSERWQPTPPRELNVDGKRTVIFGNPNVEGREDKIHDACEEIIRDLHHATGRNLADTENDALWDENDSLKCTQFKWPLPNVWLGVSVEDQTRADERREPMFELAKSRWTTFVSYEPAIGPVDWRGWHFLHWIISGGESGPRPSHPDWHRNTRDFCARAGVAYFFKQWGSWAPVEPVFGSHEQFAISASGKVFKAAEIAWPRGSRRHELEDGESLTLHTTYPVGKKAAGRLLDGIEHNAFPEVAA